MINLVSPNLTWGLTASVDFEPSLPYQQRMALAVAAQMLAGTYQFIVQRIAPVGFFRLLLSVPTLAILVHIHAFFNTQDEVLARTSFLFTCFWLGTFKVAGACMNRGPLARQTPLTWPQFMVLLFLPIFPAAEEKLEGQQGRLGDMAHSPSALFVYAVGKIKRRQSALRNHLILAFLPSPDERTLSTFTLALVVTAITFPLPRIVACTAYAFGLVGFLGLIMDLPASIATSFIGLKIIPTFDAPWLSTSFGDWWGRRWNITTSATLRTVIYDPIVEGCLIKPSSSRPSAASAASDKADKYTYNYSISTDSLSNADVKGSVSVTNGNASDSSPTVRRRVSRVRRVLAVIATFLVSGIAHEIILHQDSPALPDGSRPWAFKWLLYFTLQAPILIGELELKRIWRHKGWKPLPWTVSLVITLLSMYVISEPLFFAPVDKDSDLAQRVVVAVQRMFESFGVLLQPVVSRFADTKTGQVLTKAAGSFMSRGSGEL